MGDEMSKFDWESYCHGRAVECKFTPRKTCRGMAMRQELESRIGETLNLTPLFLMGDNDKYPGEWALGAADRRSDVFGRAWVASGDVTPIEQGEVK